jgi:type IV pilus assembly protein PilE
MPLDATTRRSPSRGFTLIELMIAVVIVSVLAAIALPSFFGQMRKSRRAEAVAVTSQIQQAQERFRANCPCYAHSVSNAASAACPSTCPGTGSDPGLGIAAGGGARYTYGLSSVTATGYVLAASAVVGTSQASDTGCTTLTVTVTSGTASQTPTQCWSR